MALKFALTFINMRILTEKGWLEPLCADHAEPLFNIIHASRSHLHVWLPWLRRIHSIEDTRAFIEKLLKERGPQFVICVDRQLCGGVGFYTIDKRNGLAGLGYWLGSEFCGHGIMRDAIQSICQYGFQHLHLERIEIRCAADNEKSRSVAERLGFCFDGLQSRAEWVTDRYVDHAIYSMEAGEFPVVIEQILDCR